RQMPARAGIDRAVGAMEWAMRRIGRGGDIGAGAEAGIDEPARIELVERLAIVGEVVGLAAGLAGPGEGKPSQILEHGRLVLALAAADIDVLDADQKSAVRLAGAPAGDPCRISRAEMQLAGRAGGKTRHHVHFPTLQCPVGACYAVAMAQIVLD